MKPDDCDEKEYTDSEDEELGMWYDLSVRTPGNRVDEEMSEPFSLDLDLVWNKMTGQPEVIQSGVMQDIVETDKGENGPESTETKGEAELTETRGTQETTQRDETLDVENHSLQEDAETETETRQTQRARRAPFRLTYDTPGHPSILAAHSVRYVSCLYKWIGYNLVIGASFIQNLT